LAETIMLERGPAGRPAADEFFERALGILSDEQPEFPGWAASILAIQARGLAAMDETEDAIAVLDRALRLFAGDPNASKNSNYLECASLLTSLQRENRTVEVRKTSAEFP
jgi:hypothetical protein